MNTDMQRMADLMTDLEVILADGQAANMLGLNVLLNLTSVLALNFGVSKPDLLRIVSEFYQVSADLRLQADPDPAHLH